MASKFKGAPKGKPAQSVQVAQAQAKTQAQLNEAIALHQQGQLAQAKAICERILKGSPKHAQVLHILGVIAYQTGNYQVAADLIGKAIAINPSDAASYSNRGNALFELKQFEAAIESYDRAISIKPDYSEAYNNRGNALKELKQLEASVESLERAITMKPDYAEAYINLGNALQGLKQFEGAVESYERALSLKPNIVEAYNNRGNALLELREFNAAVQSYERALNLKPDLDYLLGNFLYARMNSCDWKDFEARKSELNQKIGSNAKACLGFNALSLTDSRATQRKAAEIYSEDKYPAAAKPVWSGQRYEHARIRVAYVSCDFKLHPAALNNIGMWERHDRSRFELIAISYGPVHPEGATPEGQMRTRLVKAFDKFLDVGGKSDEQVARLMQELEVDIAVDITGTMQGARQGIFAHRPAPVQVNLYAYTSGAPYMDYLVADRVVIPPEHQDGYTEQVVYMPESFSASDASRQVSSRQFTRSEMGLPEVGVVYCSFNNAYKFNPQMFDVWMRVLQQVPGSVLWLQGSGQEKVKENLRREAVSRGVDPERLVFAVKIESMGEHLARHRLADVFLDTLPFNAQTTAVDALWAGLPVLTCLGESSFGRIAGSVLMALGMPELVAASLQEYEAQAVRIGLESGYAKGLKEKLERNKVEAPLFDTARLTRHMERAYEGMHERARQGLGAQAVEVQAQEQEQEQEQRRPEPAVEVTQTHAQAQAQAQFNEAIALHQQGQLGQAKAIYERILQGSPRHAQALHMLGAIAYQTGNYQAAVDLIGQAIAINPSDAASYSNRGNALLELKQYEAAIESYDKAISIKPDYAEAFYNRGLALQELKQLESALVSYDKAISLKPDYSEAHNNRGNTLLELKQLEAALFSYDKAISLEPNYAEAHSNRGTVLKDLRQLGAALSSYDKAISLKPDHAEAIYNRGTALLELQQLEAAVSSYDKAISLKPDYPEAHNNRGNALKDLNQLEAAVASYDKAISLKPDYADAHNNRGNALAELRRLEGVLTSYEITLRLNPDYEYLLGKLLYTKLQLCDWQGVDARTAELIHKIQNKAKASVSFNVLSLSGSLSVQRKAAEIYSQDKYPAAAKPVWSGQRYEHARIRVAYVSCDFKLHPAALNNIGMWERSDRDKFELIAISYGPVYPEDATPRGQMRTRLVRAFDRFLDVGEKSDEQIASLMRELEIDIAIDISGTMQDGRQGIFAHRPAPVQVNLYAYTSGAPYMDYIVADRVVIPPEYQWGYTEQVVYMPDSYWVADDSRQVSSRQFTRGEMVLPESGVVYCSFNNAYKINPQMFDVWMRVLQQVPGSVLWLQGGGQEKVKENLRREASARGVDPTRLVFAVRVESMAEHLARHRLADVFLDTLPFNAQTTAVDALWAGLPVLTCLGESSFGRIAGSVLMALGMPELVAASLQEYEVQAVRIGLESGYAKSLKDKLERNRKEAPLFDTTRLTRHMERAYERMHERVGQGLGAQAFEVQAQEVGSRMQEQRRPELEAEVTQTQAQAQAQFNEAIALHQQGQLGQAKAIYEGILQGSPRHAQALHMLGVIAYQTGNYQAAVDLIGRAIAINPNDAASYSNRGNALLELKQYEAAVESYDKAISIKPELAVAYNNRGNALSELKELEAAIESYERAISLKPDYADAYSNLGTALKELRRFKTAVDNYERAISLNPSFFEAYYNLGNALLELKQFEAAVEICNKAISLKPDYAEAYNNRGNALLEMTQLEAALESYERAISLKPDYAEAYSNRGTAFLKLRRLDEAVQSYGRAITLKSDLAESYSNLGAALKELKQFQTALENCERAIILKPEYAEAHNNRGNVLEDLGRFDAAVESYERALSLKPDHEYLPGSLLHARMNLCGWQDFDTRTAELIDRIQSNAKVSLSFNVLSVSDSLMVQRNAAEIYSQDKYPDAAQPMWSGQRYEHARIRVAYVSCDFKVHPAALNNIGMWERSDRDKFELIAISYGPVHPEDATPEGQMRTRLVKAFDKFLDVGGKSDEQVARLMQELEVDIAVDITGTMQGARQGIFAHRPAPVQVNLYGYTSGAPYMDYLIADRVVIPPEHQWGYTEQVVYMPESFSASDDSRQVSSRQFTRGEMGLPESGVVYCSFNNAYKINPKMFDVWMRILQQVPGSVLWLQGSGQEGLKENLRREAGARGVDPERLVFAQKIESMAEHLARHRLADVFLDTLPFNAQTTAVDALWAGLPVLTCLGESSFGRIAGSVLMALGMPELVAASLQEYEAQAVRIGLESGYAKGLKEKLERNKVEAPLFDTARLTRHMESAYEGMHERVQQGVEPQGFEVEATPSI